MKRKFWLGASFSALVVAAMAPWSASHANGVSIRINAPEFGIRIGAPHRPAYYPAPVYHPAPVYYPAPVYQPRHYGYAPPRVVYVAPPRFIAPPHFVGGYRGHGQGHQRHHWQHRDGRHDRWQNDGRGDDDRGSHDRRGRQ